MVARLPVRGHDLRALADIVTCNRPDASDEGLPPSLLGDLARQIRCDLIGFGRLDSAHEETSSVQALADGDERVVHIPFPVNWQHYWHCELCSFPDRTGDLHSIVTTADFYSVRQWHSVGTRCGLNRPLGFEHAMMLTLPAPQQAAGGTMRLYFLRDAGPDFSEHDRDALTLLRPHLQRAFVDAESLRHPVPRLTPRQGELLRLVAAGDTNAQIGRQLGISEGTVRIHLAHIYVRLNVSSRMAAVHRAFPAGLAALSDSRPPTTVFQPAAGSSTASTR
jgi:DNA-binding CsgD family transcriptional regulator